MDTIEGNKLIAKFMGCELQIKDIFPYRYRVSPTLVDFSAEELIYHSSWEWLMPVWSKCYSKLIEINSTSCWFYINDMKAALIKVDIKQAWKILVASIEFIHYEQK